jgi:hypothetical protein
MILLVKDYLHDIDYRAMFIKGYAAY